MPTTDTQTEPQKRTIFDIDAELDQIAMALDQFLETGEEQPILDAMERYFGDLLDERDRKIDAYCRLISELLAKAKARKAEADRIAALAKTDENSADRLKKRLQLYFESKDITKMDTATHKLWIQANGGVQALTVSPDAEADPTMLPKKFRKVTITVDKDAVRAELARPKGQRNRTIAKLCVLEPRGNSLRIK